MQRIETRLSAYYNRSNTTNEINVIIIASLYKTLICNTSYSNEGMQLCIARYIRYNIKITKSKREIKKIII